MRNKTVVIICQEMMCGKGMSLFADETQVEREMAERPMAENSRGWRQQPEMNDDR